MLVNSSSIRQLKAVILLRVFAFFVSQWLLFIQQIFVRYIQERLVTNLQKLNTKIVTRYTLIRSEVSDDA